MFSFAEQSIKRDLTHLFHPASILGTFFVQTASTTKAVILSLSIDSPQVNQVLDELYIFQYEKYFCLQVHSTNQNLHCELTI